MVGQNILVLIPHPDDEVVGASTAIERAVAAGSCVLGAYLTDGVPLREVLWPWQRRRHPQRVSQRRNEAGLVAECLQLRPVLEQNIATRRLRFHIGSTLAALRDVITAYAVDRIWVPAYEGGHQDHDVANFLGSQLARLVPVWEFAEYHYAHGRTSSQEFVCDNASTTTLTLSEAESERKSKMLALYRSERQNLSYVQTRFERFRALVSYDYAQPPHLGRAFYQRFQWVPAHPRIDYTRPAQVCESLVAFMDSFDAL